MACLQRSSNPTTRTSTEGLSWFISADLQPRDSAIRPPTSTGRLLTRDLHIHTVLTRSVQQLTRTHHIRREDRTILHQAPHHRHRAYVRETLN